MKKCQLNSEYKSKEVVQKEPKCFCILLLPRTLGWRRCLQGILLVFGHSTFVKETVCLFHVDKPRPHRIFSVSQ